MELSWRDKYNFYQSELKRNLHTAYRTIRHKRIFGGIGILWLIVVGVVWFYTPEAKKANFPFSIITHSPSNTLSGDQANNPTHSSDHPATPSQSSSTVTLNLSATQSALVTPPSKTKNASFPPSNANGNQSTSGSSSQANDRKTDLTNIATLYFYESNGQLVAYIPPSIPPINVTWTTYINVQDHYSVDYPVGWQLVKAIYNGHEGISLYPPGMDTTLSVQNGLKEIGFGVSNYSYQIPFISGSLGIYSATIEVTGYPGTLYTQGQMGTNTIAVIFPYNNNYFGMGSTANSDDIIYVFQHMLASLQLGI